METLFDLAEWDKAGPVVHLHAAFALAALGLGFAVLVRRKGDRRHRWLGRLWVGLVALVALTSFFIHEIRLVGPFSPIHLLSVYVLIGLVFAIRAARLGQISRHRATMRSIFIWGFVVAGGFSLLPDRLVFESFLRGPLEKLLPEVWQVEAVGYALPAIALIIAVLMFRPAKGWSFNLMDRRSPGARQTAR